MTDIVVRYEKPECDCCVPEGGKAWLVHYGGSAVSFERFLDAREYAKHVNGGTLPRVNTTAYADMFPDRLVVVDLPVAAVIHRGRAKVGAKMTLAAAMTAAHELAKGVGV